MERRRFLVATGTTTAVALAGCLGGNDGSSADTDSPEGAVESWYEAQNEGDEDLADAVLHSQSPQRPFETQQVVGGVATVESTAVVAENLDAEGIRAEVQFELTEATVEAVAEAENAIVEVTISFEADVPDQTRRHLVAVENGEWRVVA